MPAAAIACRNAWADRGAGPVTGADMCRRGQLFLDPDLCRVGDPDLAIEHAGNQGHVLALQRDASRLEQLNDPPDVVRAAGDPGSDQPASGIHPELLVADDRSGMKFLRELPGREGVGTVEALGVGLLAHGRGPP